MTSLLLLFDFNLYGVRVCKLMKTLSFLIDILLFLKLELYCDDILGKFYYGLNSN